MSIGLAPGSEKRTGHAPLGKGKDDRSETGARDIAAAARSGRSKTLLLGGGLSRSGLCL